VGIVSRAAAAAFTATVWPFLRRPGDPTTWRQRWSGHTPTDGPVDLWVHGASVGELSALVSFLRREAPQLRAGVTLTSGRGAQRLRERFPDADLQIMPLPLPLSPAAERLRRDWRPGRLVLVEAEIWPDIARLAADGQTPLSILGGRVNAASRVIWQRFRLHRRAALHGIWVSTPAVARDYRRLAVDPAKIHSGFHLKLLDIAAPAPHNTWHAWRRHGDYHLVLGSWHPKEIPALQTILMHLRQRGLQPRVLLVPRHPQTASEIKVRLEAAGESVAFWPQTASITLVDRFGLLPQLYAIADAALLGGTWNRLGGHNPLEAVVQGTPTVSGPSIANQRDLLGILPQDSVYVEARPAAAAARLIALADRRWQAHPPNPWGGMLQARHQHATTAARQALGLS